MRLLVGHVAEALELPAKIEVLRGLGRAIPSSSRLSGLEAHLAWAERVVVQNVMNPVALERLSQSGLAHFIIQDHRLFCPGLGKTLPDGRTCTASMSMEVCPECLPDLDYCRRTLDLTRARAVAMDRSSRVVLSNYMMEELAALDQGPAELIPPGIDLTSLPVPEAPRHGFLLAGRLVSHKSPVLAVEAWKASGSRQPLRVAGEGSQLDAIQRAAEGAAGDLEILGWLDQARLFRELGRVTALLFPAHWQEPLGILGLQALAMATPVILSAGGGTLDWSEEGCIRVEPGDRAAMTKAIQAVESDPAHACQLGERGRARVQAGFQPELFQARWNRALGFSSAVC